MDTDTFNYSPIPHTSAPPAANSASQVDPAPPPATNGHTPPSDALLRDLSPGHARSLAGIALRAFLLGFSVALNTGLTIYLSRQNAGLWRATAFLALLSLFHFLEFFVTARYNPREATVAAFLLASNGAAYNIAHASALAECVVTSLVAPRWQAKLSGPVVVVLALGMVFVGQVVRSWAMATAGGSFNHTIQTRKREGHELVTNGIYAWLRHPSYFGFFWWALGTQLLCGNVVCFAGYAVVLWRFFGKRIEREEELLVRFFGTDYTKYRETTRVGIPFL